MISITRKQLIILTTLTVVGYWCYQYSQPKVWGDSNNEAYITIAGKKPADATLDAWVIFGSSGQDCKAKTFSASNGWSSGADVKWHITHNFSTEPNQYELRIPYQQYRDSLDCDVMLGEITIKADNQFDQGGFANLRISQAGNDYNNTTISLDSKIEAKDCNGNIYPWAKDMWKGSINCNYYINEKQNKTRLHYNNGYTAYLDFSQFNDNTAIHYDILAGKDYRSEPFAPKIGE